MNELTQMLSGVAGYRLTLDSAENCLRAHVNPITGRHLITAAQADTLTGMLERLRNTNTQANDRALLESFAPEAVDYLRQTTDVATVDTAMAEFEHDRVEFYQTHHRLKFLPKQASPEERMAYQPKMHHVSRAHAVQATGALRHLHTVFNQFMAAHALSSAMVGHACIGSRTHEPMKPATIVNAVSVLSTGKSVPAPFRYIADHPDEFFTRLEAALSARDGCTHPITAQERAELCDAVVAAQAQAKSGMTR